MKASKFTEAQKAFILKQGDEGVSVAEICREAGISQATYFNWKKKYPRHAAAGDDGKGQPGNPGIPSGRRVASTAFCAGAKADERALVLAEYVL